MAFSYLRIRGFVKQISTCSKILSHLSGQSGQLGFGLRATHSVVSSGQNLDPDTNVNSERKPSGVGFKTDDQKAVSRTKVLHRRILTKSEIEEEENWKTKPFRESDSFGDVWRGKQKGGLSAFVPPAKPLPGEKKTSRTKQKHLLPEKKTFEKHRRANKNDADTFGKLSDDRSLRHLLEDVRGRDKRFPEDDADEGRTHIRLSKVNRFQEPYWYAKKIKNLGQEGKVLEAIDVLEETMLKRDRVMPTTYVFNQLFGILGNVGYTKKAFSLFNKMKKMGLKPDGHTYTCLFNCCSNSPWPNDGFQRAQNLHHLIKQKETSLHPITYKAMIKAYGVCGDIHAAFQAADEMCKLHRPDQQLYSFLLMACVSDTNEGLAHAVKVWKMMREMKIKPDLPLYNLLLRVIRDSAFGTSENVKKFPKSRNLHSEETTKDGQSFSVHFEEEEPGTSKDNSSKSVSLETKDSDRLGSEVNLFGVSSLSAMTDLDLSYPENRLAVLGGPLAILEDMKKNGVKPSVITFTQVIDSLAQENEAELQVLEYMKSENITRDIDLYNMIIRRRNRRNDYHGATEVLKYIAEEDLFPNLRTFGCLAMGCTSLQKAKQLLQNIDEAGLEPNIEIFGLFAYKSALDFEYKKVLLDMLKEKNIHPNKQFLQNVEKSIQSARNKILKMERNEPVADFFKSEKFKSSFENFMVNYSKWLKSMEFDQPAHPWQDFRHPKQEEEREEEEIKDKMDSKNAR